MNDSPNPEHFLMIDPRKIKSIEDIKIIISLLSITIHKDQQFLPYILHLFAYKDLHKYTTLN